MAKEQKEDFSWEENTHTFFESPEATVTINPEAVIESVEKDEIVEKAGQTAPAATEETEEKEEEHQFTFGGTEEETEEEEEESDEDDESDDKKPADKNKVVKVDSKSTLEFLKEKGLVEFELEEGEELTEEMAENILEDTWESSIDAGVDEVIKDLPDALKNMIKFVTNGGDFATMFTKMASTASTGLSKDTDMTKEENQVLAVTADLREQGFDDEYIETHIQVLKDSEKLELIATKSFDKITAKQAAEEAAEVDRVTKAKEASKKKQREFKTELTTHLGTLKDVKGLTLSAKDQKELPSYISDVSVELEDGRVTTGLQKDLFSIFGDKDKLVLLAKLVKSDFDLSSIAKKSVTEFSKEVEKGLQNTTSNIKGSKGSSQKPKRSLADRLD